MTEQMALQQLQQLPDDLKQEALDFIGYLWTKYNAQKPEKKRPQFGSAKGKYQMAEDFDAPLDVDCSMPCRKYAYYQSGYHS